MTAVGHAKGGGVPVSPTPRIEANFSPHLRHSIAVALLHAPPAGGHLHPERPGFLVGESLTTEPWRTAGKKSRIVLICGGRKQMARQRKKGKQTALITQISGIGLKKTLASRFSWARIYDIACASSRARFYVCHSGRSGSSGPFLWEVLAARRPISARTFGRLLLLFSWALGLS